MKLKSILTSFKTLILLAVLGVAMSLQAIPTPISGDISFSGTATIDNSSFLTASKFTAFQNVFVGAPVSLSGDYTGLSGASVFVTPFTWNPANFSTPVQPLWTLMSGGNTYSFDLTTMNVDFISANGLFLSGVGTAYISGPDYDRLPTNGEWNFSSQTLGRSAFTFSSSTNVPDGGSTLLLMGMALGFLGLTLPKRH